MNSKLLTKFNRKNQNLSEKNNRIFGLIGFPIEHSYSPQLFKTFFINNNIVDAEYHLFPFKDISIIRRFIEDNKNIVGLNVTMPYKKSIIPYLDCCDEIAKQTGAVNTVKIERNNNNIYLKGYNTDYEAIQCQLNLLFPDTKIRKALILGTGGSAITASKVLIKTGTEVIFVSRNPSKINQISYKDIDKSLLSEVDIVINATPVGMFPNNSSCPDFPFNLCNKNMVFLDMIYNPPETLFLNRARKIGANTENGMLILKLQANASWKIWNK